MFNLFILILERVGLIIILGLPFDEYPIFQGQIGRTATLEHQSGADCRIRNIRGHLELYRC